MPENQFYHYWDGEKPYQVFTEDHSDFYKDPPVRPKIGEFGTYLEAVNFALNYLQQNADSLESDPFCVYIMPEPAGLHFDSHAAEKIFLPPAEKDSN